MHFGCFGICFPDLITSATKAHGDHKAKTLAIGESMPGADVAMVNVNGDEPVPLGKLKGENGTLVMFSCNTCPFVIAYEDRFPELQKTCAEMGIGLAIVNSNEAKRERDDSEHEMASYTKRWGMTAPYLIDQRSKVADMFGAFVTPEVFLFNAESELVYKGAIDDNWKSGTDVTEDYLDIAMKAMLAGEEIKTTETKARGCSIKRLK